MLREHALVTGSAGFVGSHLSWRLLRDGWTVTGIDAMTPYYDVRLKERRHAELSVHPNFQPLLGNLSDAAIVERAFRDRPNLVVHLAAQAGVRHSISHPWDYTENNVSGTLAVLEGARKHRPEHLMIASSSSVYGMTGGPSRETDNTDRPASLYAATKKATEAMSHSYSHLFGIPITCLRFFTVFGPSGRPDMAPYRFADAIVAGRPIDLYGHGRMKRDFTYVDDVVEAVVGLSSKVPVTGNPVSDGDSLSKIAPWRVVNVAGGRPVELMSFVSAMEDALGRPAVRRMLPVQPGDVVDTAADTELLLALTGTIPKTPIEIGVRRFAEWYSAWHGALNRRP